MSDSEAPLDFETSMKALERIVQEMEAGDLSLETALAKFERGVQLSRQAESMLTNAEQKVKMLMTTQENGEQIVPFDASGLNSDS